MLGRCCPDHPFGAQHHPLLRVGFCRQNRQVKLPVSQHRPQFSTGSAQHLDVRPRCQACQCGEQWGHEYRYIVVRQADPQRPADLGRLEMRHRLALQGQNAARIADQLSAVMGEYQAAALVLQQVARQALRQLGQVQANGRRRLVHQLGRAFAAAGIGKSHQGAQLFGIQEHAGATVDESSIVTRQTFDCGERPGRL